MSFNNIPLFSMFRKKSSISNPSPASFFIEKSPPIFSTNGLTSSNRSDHHFFTEQTHHNLVQLFSINKSCSAFFQRTLLCKTYIDPISNRSKISKIHTIDHTRCGNFFEPSVLTTCIERYSIENFDTQFYLLFTSEYIDFIYTAQQFCSSGTPFISLPLHDSAQFFAQYFTLSHGSIFHTQQQCTIRLLPHVSYENPYIVHPPEIDPLFFLDPIAKTQII